MFMSDTMPAKRTQLWSNPEFLSPFVSITLDPFLAPTAGYYLETCKGSLQHEAVQRDQENCLTENLRLRERVFCVLRTFEEDGCAIRHTDPYGNITFESTPQLFRKVKFQATRSDATPVTILPDFAIPQGSRRELTEAVKERGEDVVCEQACEIFREGGTPCPHGSCARWRDYGGETCRDVCRWLIEFFSRNP
jgi:hypothetical protein